MKPTDLAYRASVLEVRGEYAQAKVAADLAYAGFKTSVQQLIDHTVEKYS